MRWKNGGGWTTELATFPAQDASVEFDWRISIAEIESDGDFSPFPGCDRSIALLDGAGMELHFDSSSPVRLERRLEFVHFAGEAKTRGTLLAGAVRDFNVIVRRDACSAKILHRPLVGPMVFLPEAATTWFVYLAAGSADARFDGAAQTLAGGESLLLDVSASGGRCVLDGGGEVALVKLGRKVAPG
jgi:environmental stress-induced protein Ves